LVPSVTPAPVFWNVVARNLASAVGTAKSFSRAFSTSSAVEPAVRKLLEATTPGDAACNGSDRDAFTTVSQLAAAAPDCMRAVDITSTFAGIVPIVRVVRTPGNSRFSSPGLTTGF
jgi:hypothetical protein